uniref:Uncharacterized protein n=1 Tax=Stomoxys calcitrans TaxID=35570 RepID=A0A1I8PYP5_STOCA
MLNRALTSTRSTSSSAFKMPVFSLLSSSSSPSSMPSSRNVAITFTISSVVNLKMFLYVVLILTNCLSWRGAVAHGSAIAALSHGDMPLVKSSSLVGDIFVDTAAHETNAGSSGSSSSEGNGIAATSASNINQPAAATVNKDSNTNNNSNNNNKEAPSASMPTGSASSRFNVDLRGATSVSSTGAIQSPTTFIGGDPLHQLQHYGGLRRKPLSLTATKSAFEEK